MRAFLAVLDQGKRVLEDRLLAFHLSRLGRWVLLPACLLLVAAYATAWWPPLAAGILLPAASLVWLRRGRPRLSLAETARTVDTEQSLNDVLTTAHEFQPRESQSPVLAALMEDADRRVQGLALPPVGRRERLEPVILIALFLVLLLLNLLRPGDGTAAALEALQESVKGFKGDSRERRDLEKAMQGVQQAGSGEQRSQAAAGMQQAVAGAQATQDLQQAGQALARADTSRGVGQAMASGNLAQAAEAAQAMARQAGAGLSPEAAESLRQALGEAQSQLNHGSTRDLRSAMQEMQNNIDNPERLQQAANQLARELEKLAQRQESLGRISQQLARLMPNSGQGSGSGSGSGSGQGSSTGAGQGSGASGQGGQSGAGGQGTGQGRQSGSGGQSGQPGQSGQSGAGSGTGSGGGSGGASPWQPPPGMQKTGGTTTGLGAGGKQAGGQVTQDPQKIVKEGKGKRPPAGKALPEFTATAEVSSSPQLMPDYEKGALLTDQERQRLQAGQETVARSREIDEFCQQHRATPRLRTYLRDFFALPAAPSPRTPGPGPRQP
ncbi:MAG: hypothetical protein GX442_02405 [Candidatus Riflebacteria bacterium]|nr:hypothetical protein [Candidatus Riflebacteria bacterium]